MYDDVGKIEMEKVPTTNKCRICGSPADDMLCPACSIMVENLAKANAGPHASDKDLEIFKKNAALASIVLAEYIDDEGFSYAKVLDELEEEPKEIGGISKRMGRHMFFSFARKSINTMITAKSQGEIDDYNGAVVFRTYKKNKTL
jgi:hypothetical protein